MAQRRMFSKTIVESARFIKMPLETQALYFHLCLYADDDGVVEAFPIMRLLGMSEDSLKILVAKNFVTILNEDLVSFILNWQEHNLIRADRKVDSIYKDLLLSIVPDVELIEPRERTEYQQKREDATRLGELPYSFTYKIRRAFWYELCPVCGFEMNPNSIHKPSVQHNKKRFIHGAQPCGENAVALSRVGANALLSMGIVNAD